MHSTGAVALARDLRAERLEQSDDFAVLVGRSQRLRQAVQRARVLAKTQAAVLLQGETGVGKEVFARAIHASSSCRNGPFVAVNCGGLPRDILASELFGYVEGAFTGAKRSGMVGKIEAARGGTLFLDEIAEMPLELQPYLLRVLEGGEVYPIGSSAPRMVEFRLIAACNRDLRSEVAAGRFRSDLYYRTSVAWLDVPALRHRIDDIPLLVEAFARETAARHGVEPKAFDDDVLEAFARYDWPGNVRELRNVVEVMVLFSDGPLVGASCLPPILFPGVESPSPTSGVVLRTASRLEQAERIEIDAAIRAAGGNLTRAARELNIARSTIYLKAKKYQLEPVIADARVRWLR
jgi:transcriptional regulator with PAS, ATPase and Fis domain